MCLLLVWHGWHAFLKDFFPIVLVSHSGICQDFLKALSSNFSNYSSNWFEKKPTYHWYSVQSDCSIWSACLEMNVPFEQFSKMKISKCLGFKKKIWGSNVVTFTNKGPFRRTSLWNFVRGLKKMCMRRKGWIWIEISLFITLYCETWIHKFHT